MKLTGRMEAMAKAEAVKKYSKRQFLSFQKYKDYYVLNELLADDGLYTIDEVEKMLKVYKKGVTK